MKKILCLILIFTSLFFVSCAEKPPVPEKEVEPYSASMMHAAVELSSRVILVQTGGLWYYSKADGESYRFCFNPLCQHKFADKCPSALFWHSHSLNSQLVYCEENNRVYIGRGQKIYSTSFDASDLQLECSLGENGDIAELTYDISYIRNLRCYKNYIYFIYNNDDTGNNQVVRYDIKTKQVQEMTSATDEQIVSYEIASDYVYFKAVLSDNTMGFYTADMDFNNRKLDENPIDGSAMQMGMTMDLYDGKYFHGKIPNEGYYIHDPITGERKLISTDQRIVNAGMLLAVHDGWMYFCPYDLKGTFETMYNSVYRISNDGIIEKCLDMPEIEIMSLNFVSNGVIINYFNIFINGTSQSDSTQKLEGFLHFDVDESGVFSNPKPVGRQYDDTELIEYLKGKS